MTDLVAAPRDDVIGVVWIALDGKNISITHQTRDDAVQLPRRSMANALRMLADAFDAEADEVGD